MRWICSVYVRWICSVYVRSNGTIVYLGPITGWTQI